MLGRFRQRRKDDEGLTLIELMVVVFLTGIMIAIAVPTFLGARHRAQDRAAQSDLRHGIAAARRYFADGDTYLGFDETEGKTIEPSLTWVAFSDPAIGAVAVDQPAASGDDVLLVAESGSGAFFCIYNSARAGTTFGTGAAFAAVDTGAECPDPRW